MTGDRRRDDAIVRAHNTANRQGTTLPANASVEHGAGRASVVPAPFAVPTVVANLEPGPMRSPGPVLWRGEIPPEWAGEAGPTSRRFSIRRVDRPLSEVRRRTSATHHGMRTRAGSAERRDPHPDR